MELLSSFNETCRLCCKKCNEGCNMSSLFDGNDGRTLAAKITKFTGIKIEPQDGLPPVACMKCTEQVNRMVNFIEICHISNKILTHLFQKYHNNVNNLSSSNTGGAYVSQYLPHASSEIKTLLPVSPASDFRDRTQSSATVPRTIVSQHNDSSQFSKPAIVTAVNNSSDILKSVTSTVSIHESSVSACKMSQIHTPLADGTHEKDNKNNQSKSSDNNSVNFLPSPCSIIRQSVPSNSNDLYHGLEYTSSSSGSVPGTKENSHSITVVQQTSETNPSEMVQEKCQAVLAKQPLYSAVVEHATKAESMMNLDTGSVTKSGSTISQILIGTHDSGIHLYNKENTIQQPHSHNLTHKGKPFSNTKNYTQICDPENKEQDLTHGQDSVQDAWSRSVHNTESSVMHSKCTPLPGQNDNVSIATLPSVEVTSSCHFTPLHNISQHKSGASCTHPPPPLVPLRESWRPSRGVHGHIPKTVGRVAGVKNRSALLISGLDRSYDRECSSTEMNLALEQHVPSRTPATSMYMPEENKSLVKHSTSNIHSNVVTTKPMSQGKSSPSLADIPASTSKILLNPSEVSEVVRAIGSELGVFFENDDTVGNISQASEYSASGSRVTTEYSNPNLRRNLETRDETTGPAMLQAHRDLTFRTGQTNNIHFSHRDINKQPQTSFPLPQQQFPKIMSSTNYTSKAVNCVPHDYQGTPSRCAPPVNKHTKRRKKLPEEEYSTRPKQRKCGPRKKSCVSKQETEDNLRKLLAAIKVAFPDMRIPTQEELQSTITDSHKEKQLGLSEIQGFNVLKTGKRSGKELQKTDASEVQEEAEQPHISPEVSTARGNAERLNKLHSFRIKITKTNGKYRSSSPQKYFKSICQDAEDLSAPEQVQNARCEYRPCIKIHQLKPYQLAPFVIVKRLHKFFVPDVTYRLTDVNVLNLLDTM